MTALGRPEWHGTENVADVLEASGTPEPPRTRREARERELAQSASRRRSESRRRRPRTDAAASAPRPERRHRGIAKAIGSRLLSFGAMLFAGALAVGMSVPANAFNSTTEDLVATFSGSGTATARETEAQTLEVEAQSADASVVARDTWTVKSWAEVLREKYGTRDFSYTVGTGPIRWPFPYAVPISSGFGERVAPCRGCSTYHQGLDFNPGNGAPIYAIADGVVTDREDGYGGFGNYVVITHQIDGQTVTSTYAHMQRGSSPLQLGQEIKVGDFVGLVGQTGQATGPHLHFEIAVDGVKVDPFTWLQRYAG